MKILHINTYAHGGAFNGAYRLHLALLKKGINSKMLVLEDIGKKPNLIEVYTYNRPFRKPNLINRIFTRLGFPHTAAQKKWHITNKRPKNYEIITLPYSDFDITKSIHYQEADIINFHWIGDYLDYPKFFRKNRKPVVFTLRDSNLLLGVFHLKNDLIRNYSEWGNTEEKFRQLKERYIQNAKFKITVVGISDWVTNSAKKSKNLKNIKSQTIHNCIDTEIFYPIDKADARDQLNIDKDKIVLLFASDSIHRINKGYNELIQALNKISNKKLELLSVGRELKYPCRYTIRHRHLGFLTPEIMRIVFSASDAFIFPTKEEALGNVMLEAMACGTPVIGTPVGGLLDVIKPGFNGLFADDVTPEGLKRAIEQFIETKDNYNPQKIRDFIKNNFSEELIASKYIQLYKELLSN